MASDALEIDVQKAEQAVSKQGDIVRSLKALLKEGKSQKVTYLDIPKIILGFSKSFCERHSLLKL